MMAMHCIVHGCTSDNENGFPFPVDRPPVNTKWLAALEKHQKLPSDYVSRLICPAHFLETDFLKSRGKAKLQIAKKAVPSVFPEIKPDTMSEDEDKVLIPADPPIIVKEEPNDIDNSEEDAELDSQFDRGEDGDSGEDGVLSEDDNYEYMEDDYDDDSRDNINGGSQNSESNAESGRNVAAADIFESINTDVEIDSDYEPVTERTLLSLQEKLDNKTETVNKDRATLFSMEEMIRNQAITISRLEQELQALEKVEEEEAKQIPNVPAIPASSSTKLAPTLNSLIFKTPDYSNNDLQLFAISLYYFSPKVYAYLGSIMPYLPPKSVVIDWVKTGHATNIFPPGVLVNEKFSLD